MDPFSTYRRPGGFLQFLLMYEAADSYQQNDIRNQLAKTDPGWAYLLKLKSLSYERILSWPEIHLGAVWREVPFALPLAVWSSAPDNVKTKIENSLPPSQRSLLRKHAKNVQTISASEIDTAKMRLVSHARELILSGLLPIQDFDPTLILNEKIQDFEYKKSG